MACYHIQLCCRQTNLPQGGPGRLSRKIIEFESYKKILQKYSTEWQRVMYALCGVWGDL